jgi:hypothetical protein
MCRIFSSTAVKGFARLTDSAAFYTKNGTEENERNILEEKKLLLRITEGKKVKGKGGRDFIGSFGRRRVKLRREHNIHNIKEYNIWSHLNATNGIVTIFFQI